MEIKVVQDQKKYLDFLKIVYKNDDFYKDNKTDLFYIVCSQKGEFYKRSKQKMISVTENGKTLCQSVFIIHNDNSEQGEKAHFKIEKVKFETFSKNTRLIRKLDNNKLILKSVKNNKIIF